MIYHYATTVTVQINSDAEPPNLESLKDYLNETIILDIDLENSTETEVDFSIESIVVDWDALSKKKRSQHG